MKKEKGELIAALDAIVREDSVLYVFLVVNKDGGDIVMRANINDENKIPPCDWEKPKEINENGYYQVLEMDIE